METLNHLTETIFDFFSRHDVHGLNNIKAYIFVETFNCAADSLMSKRLFMCNISVFLGSRLFCALAAKIDLYIHTYIVYLKCANMYYRRILCI